MLNCERQKQKRSQFEEAIEDQLVAQRITWTMAYQALPEYGSTEFWRYVEGLDLVSLNRW